MGLGDISRCVKYTINTDGDESEVEEVTWMVSGLTLHFKSENAARNAAKAYNENEQSPKPKGVKKILSGSTNGARLGDYYIGPSEDVYLRWWDVNTGIAWQKVTNEQHARQLRDQYANERDFGSNLKAPMPTHYGDF